jgi:hypothetical protein
MKRIKFDQFPTCSNPSESTTESIDDALPSALHRDGFAPAEGAHAYADAALRQSEQYGLQGSVSSIFVFS